MAEKLIKIAKLAKDLGVTKATLYNWKNDGKINFVKSKTNRNFVTLQDYKDLIGIKDSKESKNVIYCRVSSTQNKNNLKTQKERLVAYCEAKGYPIHKIIEEFGSGINDKRPKLEKLILEQDYTKIIIEHKDRLSRLGFNYLEMLCKITGKEIEIVNNVQTDEEDIIQDFVSTVTSFCARIYGKRRSKRITEKLIEQLKNQKEF
jgi:putative resolvase